jgi:hypothetical protein
MCLHNLTNPFKLSDNKIITYRDKNKTTGVWETTRGRGDSPFFFCSRDCIDQFKNNFLFRCQKCRDFCWIKKVAKEVKDGLSYCPQCFEGGETPEPSPKPKKNEKKPRPGGGNCPGEYCGGVREATGWRQGGSRNKWYCEFCWGAIFGADEDEYIKKIRSLDKLTEAEKQDFISQIHNNPPSKFEEIYQQAKDKNEKKGGDEEEEDNGDDGNLPDKIQQAIQEIEAELNKEPKLTLTNEEWRSWIKNSSTLAILKSRKQKILDDIQALRQQKGGEQNQNLTELQNHAIHQINQELEKNPPVSTQELDNPNWEEQINQAQKKETIINIRDQVLADIRSKRANKTQAQEITKLLTQAKEEENWNNYQNLESILKQIKALRSSDAYSEEATEIKAIENRLQELDSGKFKKTAEKLLDQQMKDNELTESDLDSETKAAIEEAKKDPTPQKRDKAEEGIATCGAKKKLTNILAKVGKVSTEKDKQALVSEIINFISKNKYSKNAYNALKTEVEKALAQLRGESQREGDTSPNKPSSYLVFSLCLIGALAGIAIAIFLIWRRKKRLGRSLK